MHLIDIIEQRCDLAEKKQPDITNFTRVTVRFPAIAISKMKLLYFALLIARRCRLLLFVTLMVPMSLWLAASFSMDNGLIVFSVLASALLTRSEGGDRWAEVCFWLAGLALALVFVSKPPY